MVNAKRGKNEELKKLQNKSKHDSKQSTSEKIKLFLIPCTVLGALIISWHHNHSLGSMVNTPLNEPRIIDESSYTSPENLDRFWGSYRHWCDHNDHMAKYGWTAHDGRNFGIHDVYENSENSYQIRNSWVKRHGGKHGGDWTVRTNVTPYKNAIEKQFASVIFYFATDYEGWIKSSSHKKKYSMISAETVDVGKFTIEIDATSKVNNQKLFINRATGNMSLASLKDSLIQSGYFKTIKTKTTELPQYLGFGSGSLKPLEESNFIAYQVSGFLPFEFDVIFESESLRDELKSQSKESLSKLKDSVFDAALAEAKSQFDAKFEKTFKLHEKKFPESTIKIAQATLSNLIGGIGFFSGQSIVKSLSTKENVLYWPANLYTAVPSRAFFPRGFLWDEGFHNILISQWDLEITKDILGHWLDLMNIEGWIPREVILGDEARAKVPNEFLVQNNAFANPPTLFLPLFKVVHAVNERILSSDKADHKQSDVLYLKNIYKRLGHWYEWFNTTQIGKTPFTYRWRGRTAGSRVELNPKTLTSGLDDYPRASHPSDNERHLDLRCWMALASKVMSDLSEIIGVEANKPYKETFDLLRDNKILGNFLDIKR